MKRGYACSIGLALGLAVIAILPMPAYGFADSCNGSFDLSYPGAKNFYQIGDIVNVQLMVGSLTVAPAPATLNISRFELDLQCDNNPSDSSVPCVNTQGALISYVGNLTWNCPRCPRSRSPGPPA